MTTMIQSFVEGEQVRIKDCPHIWHVYAAWSATAIHVQRWDTGRGEFERQTFVHPNMLVKV
jgi:hypothetical protein